MCQMTKTVHKGGFYYAYLSYTLVWIHAGKYLDGRQFDIRQGHLWVVAHKAGLTLQIVTIQLNKLCQMWVQVSIRMMCQQLVLCV
jgi:hypothetical protein